MKNLINSKKVTGKKFNIYTENIKFILEEITDRRGANIIYVDFYKANKKMSLRGIEEQETLYMMNNNTFLLYVTVPQDSYLSEMGIIIRENECLVEMDENEVISYLEHRFAIDILLHYFSDKLVWDKRDITSPSLCYVKNRRLYDISQSYSLKLYTDRYIRFCEPKSEYEELYFSADNKFFLNIMCDSIRTMNSNLYFRNKEAGENEKDDILPLSEKEAINWYLYRGGSLEEFCINIENAKSYLSKIN